MDKLSATEGEVADLRASYEEVFAGLLTYDQAQQALGDISRWSLGYLTRERKLVAVNVLGRHWITKDSLAAYIQELREATTRPIEFKSGRKTA